MTIFLCYFTSVVQTRGNIQSRDVHQNTRWFKYDRDKLWLVYSQIVPVIYEPPCILRTYEVLPSKGCSKSIPCSPDLAPCDIFFICQNKNRPEREKIRRCENLTTKYDAEISVGIADWLPQVFWAMENRWKKCIHSQWYYMESD
jgi:hypothetical protein